MSESAPEYALSLKQPWAALLVSGHKSIEIRRWSTAVPRRLLIHAARADDPRSEAWEHFEHLSRQGEKRTDLSRLCQYRGGILGVGTLVECRKYRALDDFRHDQEKHLNHPEWFQPPVLFGFVFTELEVLPFRRYPGWVRIFPVYNDPPVRRPRGPS